MNISYRRRASLNSRSSERKGAIEKLRRRRKVRKEYIDKKKRLY
jgi:hypothetical protein